MFVFATTSDFAVHGDKLKLFCVFYLFIFSINLGFFLVSLAVTGHDLVAPPPPPFGIQRVRRTREQLSSKL